MSFLGIRLNKKVYLEEEAFTLIISMLTLARDGKPYRHLMVHLRDSAERYPRVAMMIQGLARSLEEGLPNRKKDRS